MQKAMIIIRPNMYNKTIEALEKMGFNAFSTVNVQGRGKAAVRFSAANAHGTQDGVDYYRFIAKKMLILVFNDEDESKLVKTVIDINQTGSSGDGKIFVIPVKESIRIRTNESGIEALV